MNEKYNRFFSIFFIVGILFIVLSLLFGFRVPIVVEKALMLLYWFVVMVVVLIFAKHLYAKVFAVMFFTAFLYNYVELYKNKLSVSAFKKGSLNYYLTYDVAHMDLSIYKNVQIGSNYESIVKLIGERPLVEYEYWFNVNKLETSKKYLFMHPKTFNFNNREEFCLVFRGIDTVLVAKDMREFPFMNEIDFEKIKQGMSYRQVLNLAGLKSLKFDSYDCFDAHKITFYMTNYFPKSSSYKVSFSCKDTTVIGIWH
jgi:hypothetical protein